MQIIDEKFLAEVRKLPCAWCHAAPSSHPHHCWTKGMGSGGRIDHPWTVLPLCWKCHGKTHNGEEPNRRQLMDLLAKRNQVSVGTIITFVERTRRKKNADGQSAHGDGLPAPGHRDDGPGQVEGRHVPGPIPGPPPGGGGQTGDPPDEDGWRGF